jgi:hypothetical protein
MVASETPIISDNSVDVLSMTMLGVARIVDAIFCKELVRLL